MKLLRKYKVRCQQGSGDNTICAEIARKNDAISGGCKIVWLHNFSSVSGIWAASDGVKLRGVGDGEAGRGISAGEM